MEIISSLASELRHRNTTLLAVGFESLEILSTERPCVTVIPVNTGVEYSEVITAVAGFTGIKPSAIFAFTSTADIPGRHRWAIARPPTEG